MTETVDSTPATGRSWGGERLKGAIALAPMVRPMVRYVPKHPALWIGAAVLGAAGFLAWRNRERIRETARPMLQNAAERGAALRTRLPWTRATGTPAGLQENLH